jgi:hypothetical protein
MGDVEPVYSLGGVDNDRLLIGAIFYFFSKL